MKFVIALVAVLAVAAAAPRRVDLSAGNWDVNELSAAISNPNTDPALLPFLVQALDTLMEALWHGSPITSVPVVTPAGVVPSPSAEGPIIPGGVAEEILAPASPAAPAGSPLVQVIVNINSQSVVANPPAPVADEIVIPETVADVVDRPVPEIVDPVIVVDRPVPEVVDPVIIVDQPEVVEPVIIVEKPEVVEPVIVVDKPEVVEPVIIVDQPSVVGPINPIDVIAVAAPEVNPVDIISPVPAVAGGEDSGILV